MVADENLRHCAPAAAQSHFGALVGRGLHVDLFDRDVFRAEQTARALAVWTPARGVHDHRGLRHQAALVTGRFSARHAAKPPRSANALVKPWTLSWRTAAAASDP